jgi:DNA-binding GntR family transcriptional regulator
VSGGLARGARMPQDELAQQFGASITPVREALRREFHFLFYDRCGMPALTERIAGMWRAFPWDLMLDAQPRAEQSHQEHLVILAAVEDGDPDRVTAATELHLRNGFSAILSQLTGRPGPDPFDVDAD